VDENTVFLEASKPVPAGADERTEADAAFQEVTSAMAHLGSLYEAGIVGADEKVVWFEEKTQPAMTTNGDLYGFIEHQTRRGRQ
jgi:hypothetical protein